MSTCVRDSLIPGHLRVTRPDDFRFVFKNSFNRWCIVTSRFRQRKWAAAAAAEETAREGTFGINLERT